MTRQPRMVKQAQFKFKPFQTTTPAQTQHGATTRRSDPFYAHPCCSIFDNRWTNLTFQSSSNSVKQTASEDIALASFFACSPLSFPIDVDIKIDSVTKLQTELENGAVVSSSIQIPFSYITHITLPMTDSRRGRRYTNVQSMSANFTSASTSGYSSRTSSCSSVAPLRCTCSSRHHTDFRVYFLGGLLLHRFLHSPTGIGGFSSDWRDH